MSDNDRRSLRMRFQFCCGYCGVHELDVGAELTVDHFQPRTKGGAHEPENWVYCCHACNEFKGAYWQPNSSYRILHPHPDDLASHMILESNGALRALTQTGTFHIGRLHLNREQLVQYRRERQRLQLLHQSGVNERERLTKLLERIRKVISRIKDTRPGARDQ